MMPDEDAEHLRLLSIFHHVLAAFAGLMALFPCIHLVLGILMVRGELPVRTERGPHVAMGWMFIVLASMMILLGLSLAVGLVVAGRSLAAGRRYAFCLVMAALSCLLVPLGTVLGVFTILVLSREGVKARFRAAPAARGLRGPASPGERGSQGTCAPGRPSPRRARGRRRSSA